MTDAAASERAPSADKIGSEARHWFEGGCHCGAVRWRVRCVVPAYVSQCNCSICAMAAYQHLIVAQEDFELLQGGQALQTYSFGSGIAQHHFCGTCGIKSWYVPRSHPHGISVNFRCLDVPPEARVESFDGRDWEANVARLPTV